MGTSKQAKRIEPDRVHKTVVAARAEIDRTEANIAEANERIAAALGQTPALTAAIREDLHREIDARQARLTQMTVDDAHLLAHARSTTGLDDAARHALRERAKEAMANAITVRKGDDVLLRKITQSAHTHRHLGLVSEASVGAEVDALVDAADEALSPGGTYTYEESRYDQDDLDRVGQEADGAQIRVEARSRALFAFADEIRDLPARECLTRIVVEAPALTSALREAAVARDGARHDALRALSGEAYNRARDAYHAIIRGSDDQSVIARADGIWLGIGEALHGHDEYDTRSDASRLRDARQIADDLHALLVPIRRAQMLAVKDPKGSLAEAIKPRG